MLFNKKASLEISIQAIIIIVLAMTLLGLGLGFIRNIFHNLIGTTEDVTEQVKEQILNDLRTGDKKISFPKTEITIEKGGSTILNVGIRNKENSDFGYDIDFTPISFPDPGNPNVIKTDGTDDQKKNIKDWFQTATPSLGHWTLGPSNSDIRSVRVSVPKSATAGSYALTFTVVIKVRGGTGITGGEIYDQKDFFIVVKG